jgi:hypothetical protein
MRFPLFIAFWCSCFISNAQHLNRAGHFESTSESKQKVSVSVANQFPRARVLPVPGGYLVLPMACAGSPVLFRMADPSGAIVYAQEFRHVVNLTFSASRSCCAFYDGRNLCVFEPLTRKVSVHPGSITFDINDDGALCYYREETGTVVVNGASYATGERVYKIAFAGNDVVALTRKCVLKFNEAGMSSIFCTDSGRVFDLLAGKGKLLISVKEINPQGFIFKSYSSSDLQHFQLREEQFYPLSGPAPSRRPAETVTALAGTAESIRDPLDYFTDTVYQPVGNSYGEIQDYGSPAYLHPGVDLMGYHLQDVRAVKRGFVKAILTTVDTFHWRIAISNEDTPGLSRGYLYAHLDQQTIPYAVDDSVNEGDVVGQLVNFPVPGFVHCHFARILDSGAVWTGGWWTLENPLRSMSNLFDSVPPQFQMTKGNDVFAFRDAGGSYLSPDSLYGNIKVISKIHDLVNSGWRVDINRLSYNLSPLSSPATLLLDSFSYEYNFYIDVYAAGTYYNDILNTVYSRDGTCFSDGDYNTREFYHFVTNSDGNDTIVAGDSSQYFATANFPDGSYIFRVVAEDASGNVSSDSMVVRFYNNNTAVPGHGFPKSLSVFPNPSKDGRFMVSAAGLETPCTYELFNLPGEIIERGSFSPGNPVHRFSLSVPGIYFLRVFSGEEQIVLKLIRE